jgi:alkylation response protein AidB-like acyl-CoA dehydrogenase
MNTTTIDVTTPGKAAGYDVISDSLRQAGKSEGEIASIKAVDEAQEQASTGRIIEGPVVQSFMEHTIATELFACQSDELSAWHRHGARAALEDSIAVARHHIEAGTLFDENGKITAPALQDLGKAGFWGLPVPEEYGGSGAGMLFCMRALTQMSSRTHPIVGGLLSIQTMIGIGGPLIWKGNDEQKTRLLPKVVAGELSSGFGGTEPHVGCWITNVRTCGVERGDYIEVTGEKLFISHAWYGHAIALFLKIDGKHRVLIVELPQQDTDNFRIVNYGIHALPNIHNKGLWFKNFRVPKENLLEGDGLAIIFHDLDRGRPAVAAGASARMRRILKSCLPWVEHRVTFHDKLKERQFTRRNLALMASYIVGADTLVDWASSLTDEPRMRADIPAMIAKTVATDWLREVSTCLGMFTHGGRFVLKGSEIGDWLADDMVASVYEGPNPMLAMATVKAIAKPFAVEFVKPFVEAMQSAGLNPNKIRVGKISQTVGSLFYLLSNVNVIVANRKTLLPVTAPFFKWIVRTELQFSDKRKLHGLNPVFQDHLNFARAQFIKWRKKFYRSVMIYQEKLGDEQLLMIDGLYTPLTRIVTMLAVIMRARQALAVSDQATVEAANLLCLKLRNELTGNQEITGKYKKAVRTVSQYVLEDRFQQLAGVPAAAILQPYEETSLQ